MIMVQIGPDLLDSQIHLFDVNCLLNLHVVLNISHNILRLLRMLCMRAVVGATFEKRIFQENIVSVEISFVDGHKYQDLLYYSSNLSEGLLLFGTNVKFNQHAL